MRETLFFVSVVLLICYSSDFSNHILCPVADTLVLLKYTWLSIWRSKRKFFFFFRKLTFCTTSIIQYLLSAMEWNLRVVKLHFFNWFVTEVGQDTADNLIFVYIFAASIFVIGIWKSKCKGCKANLFIITIFMLPWT